MYVIATVICPNFHFSVSPHVPFLNLLFEQIANSNEYLLAKIGVDTVDNEPLKVSLIFKLWNIIFTEPPRPPLPIAIVTTEGIFHFWSLGSAKNHLPEEEEVKDPI